VSSLKDPPPVTVTAHHVSCFKGCSSCCEDMPIALTLDDIERLSGLLMISPEAVFQAYCIVYPSLSIEASRGSGYHSPLSLALRFPCPFLEEKRCTIHSSRPLICRIFPFNIHHNETTGSFPLESYPCMDPVRDVRENDQREFMRIALIRSHHLQETRERIPILAEGITYSVGTVDQCETRVVLAENHTIEERRSLERTLMEERIAIGMKVARREVADSLGTLFESRN
jgi:Fe-S-cluster containining protein